MHSRQNPIAILIIAIVFGAFRYGSIALQSQIGLPLDLLNIIQGVLILFFSIQYLSPAFVKKVAQRGSADAVQTVEA